VMSLSLKQLPFELAIHTSNALSLHLIVKLPDQLRCNPDALCGWAHTGTICCQATWWSGSARGARGATKFQSFKSS